jgi:hypothetical protein
MGNYFDTDEGKAALQKAFAPYMTAEMCRERDRIYEERMQIKRNNRKVYFILYGNLLKVGYSEYPEARLEQIKTSCPSARLIGSINGGIELEKEIHSRLKESHYDREWFWFSDEAQRIVKEYVK